jgi:hypothetical protein
LVATCAERQYGHRSCTAADAASATAIRQRSRRARFTDVLGIVEHLRDRLARLGASPVAIRARYAFTEMQGGLVQCAEGAAAQNVVRPTNDSAMMIGHPMTAERNSCLVDTGISDFSNLDRSRAIGIGGAQRVRLTAGRRAPGRGGFSKRWRASGTCLTP